MAPSAVKTWKPGSGARADAAGWLLGLRKSDVTTLVWLSRAEPNKLNRGYLQGAAPWAAPHSFEFVKARLTCSRRHCTLSPVAAVV